MAMSMLKIRQPGSGSKPKKKVFRADIQGLRALAVVVVIADHLFHWPSGGFVGVDVFFVISGFLITGLLLREYERTSHISFVDFYRRRAKRILPASALVLVVTLGASYLILNGAVFQTVTWDVVWAFLFAANWRFASVGTDYFQAGGPVSPIQHFWSLAVEEQFYFVWPWLMLLIFALLARKAKGRASARIAAGVAMAIISALSFLWALHETSMAPTLAYFSTFSRAWELGVGALLAVIAPVLTRLPDVLRPVLGWVGLTGIIAALFLINSESPFPAPSAALPVLASALIILSGTGGQQRGLFPLTNRVSGYLGDISYSLYLWHFPVIILAGTFVDLADPVVAVATVAAIFIMAIYSYHLVEDPIRKSSWLNGTPKRKRANTTNDRYKLLALSFLAVLTAVVVAFALRPVAPQVVAAKPTASTASAAPVAQGPQYGPAVTAIQKQIAAATRADSWPELTPSLDNAIAGRQAPADISRCGQMGAVAVDECTWGGPSATKTAVIVGDSVAMTYVGALREGLKDRPDWQLKSYAAFGCTFTDMRITHSDPSIVEACPARKALAVDAINQLHPDIVFIANTYEPRIGFESKNQLSLGEWSESTRTIVEKFKGSAKKIVFLSPPPSDVDIKSCYTRASRPSDCVSTVTSQWASMADVERSLAQSVGGSFVDSRPLSCSLDTAVCPAFVGSTPSKMDKVHMTPEYAVKIGPALAEELSRQQLL
ncbi:hypothetical protein ANMWB30_34290 [Arthrobacter sp. MWB30]|nr:hypothetical protein ANMWB30_34290 [Arthrobacter sp. MWB30]